MCWGSWSRCWGSWSKWDTYSIGCSTGLQVQLWPLAQLQPLARLQPLAQPLQTSSRCDAHSCCSHKMVRCRQCSRSEVYNHSSCSDRSCRTVYKHRHCGHRQSREQQHNHSPTGHQHQHWPLHSQ